MYTIDVIPWTAAATSNFVDLALSSFFPPLVRTDCPCVVLFPQLVAQEFSNDVRGAVMYSWRIH